MIIELNDDEIIILKHLIEHQLNWANYKTTYIPMPDHEKDEMLKDIERLTLLQDKVL